MGKTLLGAALAFVLVATAGESQVRPAPSPAAASPTYADLADLSLAAPVVAHVRLKRATPLKPGEAGIVRAGLARFYVQAEVISLVRGAAGLPAAISYLADFPNRADGKPAKPAKKAEYLLFAAPVAGRPGELRLISSDAQLPYEAARIETVRAVLKEASAPSAAPRITGIGKAFHAPGSLPGESETQIFLQTSDSRPVSLSVLRRPGEIPRWALSLTEMVDDAAEPPKPGTLLWYRLACALPRALPPQSLAEADEAQRPAIQSDYRLVIEQLGPCVRSRA